MRVPPSFWVNWVQQTNRNKRRSSDVMMSVLVYVILSAVKISLAIGLVTLVLFVLHLDITPEIMVVSGVMGYLIQTGGDKR